MKIYGIIYLLRNKVNGKCYVGQTTQTLRQRLSEHKSFSFRGYNYPIYNAISKYGWDNFEKYQLDICYTNQEDLNALECFYMEKFNTLEYGYNIREGGSKGKKNKNSIQKYIKTRTLSISEYKIKLKEKFSYLDIDESTYRNLETKAKFIDKDFGEWWARPSSVLKRKYGHILRARNSREI